MNRFLSVWLSTFSAKSALGLLALIALVLLAFALTADPLIIALAAVAFVIGIVAYSRSRSQGVERSLLSGPSAEEDRFLSFQLASGMDRKEYVDSYSVLLLIFLPAVFAVFLVCMRSFLGDAARGAESALTLTLLMVPLFYMVIHHNICAMAGEDRPARFLAMVLLYVLYFLGVLVGLIVVLDAPLLGMVVSGAIAIAAALALRSRSIEKMMRADV
ncbi:MAG: hypothetical protein IKQ60_09915 [Candidatus Methanomethylophilaceae archaeon]|nr:hypothetical protein [Candidatus Methanomethylophilaceae archaeon]